MCLLPSYNVKLREASIALERIRRGGVWNTAEGRRKSQEIWINVICGFRGLQPIEIPQNHQKNLGKSLEKTGRDLEKLAEKGLEVAFVSPPSPLAQRRRRAGLERELVERGIAPVVICDLRHGSERANLPGVTPDTLRHTMGSTAVSAGEALSLTDAILGHANPRSTALHQPR